MTDALVNGMSAGTDLVICGLMHGKKAVTPHITGSLHKRVWLNEFGKLYKNMIIPSPCNKLYRTDLLHGYDLRFPKGLTFGEDLLFNLNYFNHVEQVTILDTPFYKYRIYGDSLAHGYIDHLYTTYTALYNQMKRFLINHQAYTDTNKQLLMTQYAEAVIQSAANLYHEHAPLDKAEKRAALAAILSDSLLSVNLHYFNGSSQARLFKHFIKKNAIREAACYLSIKSSIEKIPILYPLLSRINRRG